MKRTGTILIIVGVMAAAVMTYAGAYNSILFLFSKPAVAQVLQGPSWMGREGGWRVRYEFTDEGGVTHRGQATFAKMWQQPEGIQRISIRYFPLAPGISGMEVKGYSKFTPYGLIGYLMALWLIVRGLRLRSKKVEHAAPPKGSPATPPGNSEAKQGPLSVG